MAYLRDTAVILKNEPYREHDSRVTLYGQRHGKLVTVARGSRNLKAKAMGHLEPLAQVEIMVAKGAVLDKLAVAHLVNPRPALRANLGLLSAVGAIIKMVDAATESEAVDPAIYFLLVEMLDVSANLEADPSPERAQLLFAGAAAKLMDALGYAPSWQNCAECRVALAEPVWLVAADGRLLCRECARSVSSADVSQLPEQALRLLGFMRREPLASLLRLSAPPVLFAAVAAAVDAARHRLPQGETLPSSLTAASFLN